MKNASEMKVELDSIGVIEIGEGDVFENQTGGYACHHPEVRGRKLAIPALRPGTELSDVHFVCEVERHEKFLEGLDAVLGNWFYNGPHKGHCYSFNGKGDFNETDALIVEAVFGTIFHDIKVDRARFSECEEAWVYALWQDRPVLLYWTNSD